MRRSRTLRSVLALMLVAAVHGSPSRSSAASLGELKAQAQSAGLSPGSGGAGEQAAIDRLGRTALAFLDAADAGEAGAARTDQGDAGPPRRRSQGARAGPPSPGPKA